MLNAFRKGSQTSLPLEPYDSGEVTWASHASNLLDGLDLHISPPKTLLNMCICKLCNDGTEDHEHFIAVLWLNQEMTSFAVFRPSTRTFCHAPFWINAYVLNSTSTVLLMEFIVCILLLTVATAFYKYYTVNWVI